MVILKSISPKETWYFEFNPNDNYENRAHVHVGKKNQKRAKIWTEQSVELVKEGDLSIREQNKALGLTRKYRPDLIGQWKKYKKGEKS